MKITSYIEHDFSTPLMSSHAIGHEYLVGPWHIFRLWVDDPQIHMQDCECSEKIFPVLALSVGVRTVHHKNCLLYETITKVLEVTVLNIVIEGNHEVVKTETWKE